MRPEILALFIPIIFLVGLFTAISLHIYYKYKVRVHTAEHAQGESLNAWCRAEAMARASVSRSAALRVGGFLAGAGIGTVIGMFVGKSDAVWALFGSFYHPGAGWNDVGAQWAVQSTVWAIFVIACALFVGGLCMMGAYFVDRALEGRGGGSVNLKSNN